MGLFLREQLVMLDATQGTGNRSGRVVQKVRGQATVQPCAPGGRATTTAVGPVSGLGRYLHAGGAWRADLPA